MKIIHVVEPFSSGIITFIINLSKALDEHEHLVIHGERTTADHLYAVRKRFPSSVKFKVWKYADREVNPIKDIKAFFYLYRMLRSESFDVLHLHSSKAGFLGKLVATMLGKTNVVYTPNGASFIRTDVSEFRRKIFKTLEKFASWLPGALICCGESESKIYEDIGVKSIHINNGIKLPKKPVIKFSAKTVLGCGAIITQQKNPVMFNEIANVFRNDHRVAFKWVGDGHLRSEIDEDVVKVTQWLGEPGTRKHICDLSIYLSTAQWEGQPFSVLEAMGNGKCLLLFDCPGNRDLVEVGKNGYLFKTLQEAVRRINELLNEPEKVRNMGRESYRICRERHDISVTSKKYELEYARLAGAK